MDGAWRLVPALFTLGATIPPTMRAILHLARITIANLNLSSHIIGMQKRCCGSEWVLAGDAKELGPLRELMTDRGDQTDAQNW
jgi:hypothetical protein